MKQNILPVQFKKLGKERAEKIFNLVPREDWYSYHHKKLTIGKIIETLKELTNYIIVIEYEPISESWSIETRHYKGLYEVLIDGLWEQLLNTINKYDEVDKI